MGRMPVRLALVLALMVTTCWMGRAHSVLAAEVFLGITRSEASRIPATVVRVRADRTFAGKSSEIRSVLEADLRRSLAFRMINPPSMPEIWKTETPQKELIKEIGKKGIEALIWVDVEFQDKNVVMEGYVYDGGSGTLIIRKRYTGEAKVLRKMVHRFADEVVFRYTGEKGIAQTRIAYTSRLTGSKELYLIDYDGYNPRRLTSDRSLSLSPEWSPDGRWITYTSYREGNPDIYTLDLETGQRWKMVGFPALNISPGWSPAGDQLAFASTVNGTLQLYVMNQNGKSMKRLTSGLGDNLSPTWSPNGQEIAFVSNRGGSPQIYLINVFGTNLRRLTFNGNYNTSPAWSPKGDWIAYACQVKGQMRICLIGADGTQQVQLTDDPGEQEDPAWAPDGRHLVFRSTQASRGGDLYMMTIDGKEVERLTFNGAQNGSPAWSP
jgi:TolB protein